MDTGYFENYKTIELFNALIEINNDRMNGYERAAACIKEATLRDLFRQLAKTSDICEKELRAKIKIFGASPQLVPNSQRNIYKVWQEINEAITKLNRRAILNLCEFEEDINVKIYENALRQIQNECRENMHLIEKQYLQVKTDHTKIKNLRSAFIKN